jgi:hypothetical protein
VADPIKILLSAPTRRRSSAAAAVSILGPKAAIIRYIAEHNHDA